MGSKLAVATRPGDGAVTAFDLDDKMCEWLDIGRGTGMGAEAAMRPAATEPGTDRAVKGPCLIERAEENEVSLRFSERGLRPRDDEPASVVCFAFWAY